MLRERKEKVIYERFVSGGWVGFGTNYVERLGRMVPYLYVGWREDKTKSEFRRIGVPLIHKNTDILPDLYKAIGHYLEQRKEGKSE